MKKKITAMIVCAAVVLSLTACSPDGESSSPNTSTSTKSSTESSKTESSSTVSDSSTESSSDSKPEESSAPEESTSSTESSSAPEETSTPETANIDWSTVPVVDEMDLDYEVYDADDLPILLGWQYFAPQDEVLYRGKGNAIVIRTYFGDAEYINLPDQIEGIDLILIRQKVNWGENAKAIRYPAGYLPNLGLGSAENATSVDIPDSWQNSGEFSSMPKLSEIKLPAEVQYINQDAFANHTEPKSVTIPDTVKYIGGSAFSGCTSLEQVIFPEKFAGECVIDGAAFGGCTSLKSIDIPEGAVPAHYETDAIYYGLFCKCTALEKVTLPSTWTEIGSLMFSDCTSLPEVNIPSGVKEIGTEAFYNCTSLKSIDIPDSVTRIGSGAFDGCTDISINYKGKTYTEKNISKLYDKDLSNM